MKTLIICLSIFFVSFVANKPSETVYICISNTAVAYHIDRGCKGLAACTHKIIQTTKEEAINKYNRRSCRYCCK